MVAKGFKWFREVYNKEDQNEAIDNFCKKFPLNYRNTILTAEVEKEY